MDDVKRLDQERARKNSSAAQSRKKRTLSLQSPPATASTTSHSANTTTASWKSSCWGSSPEEVIYGTDQHTIRHDHARLPAAAGPGSAMNMLSKTGSGLRKDSGICSRLTAQIASASTACARRMLLDGDVASSASEKNATGKNSRVLCQLRQTIDQLSGRRASLLQEAGYPADYLRPVYRCPDCQRHRIHRQ